MYFIARQTSDPRSGFATVEKDFPGGLTPMLGDRKVSNILIFFCDIILDFIISIKIKICTQPSKVSYVSTVLVVVVVVFFSE